MRYISVYIYDSNQLGMHNWLLGYNKTIEVKGVADMVRKLLALTAGKKQVKFSLTFGGDGAANYQSVGAGSNKDLWGVSSLQVDSKGKLKGNAADWLTYLKPFVRKIILKGAKKGSYKLQVALGEIFPCVGISTNGSLLINYGKNSAAKVRLSGRRKTSVRIIRHGGGLAELDRQAKIKAR